MTKTITITIGGTHCKACKLLIEDVCKEKNGVKSCHVDFLTGKTVIEHDEHFNLDSFKEEVESLGQYSLESNS